ncbi:MAG: carboxymuconolactone decarboxylase family protein [Hyphomicrobiales bacterium]|nr:carboxymuconolactone decarboxylase family protein [Hyphomicrobiales bacterium]
MSGRLNYATAAPEVRTIMLDFWQKVENLDLEPKLLHLIYLRASQLNGCAFCVDMHAKDMRAAGESEQKVYMTSAWREAGKLYSPRERAALAWTEAVTLLPNREVSDEVYAEALTQFSESELAKLTLAVVEINCWNRLNVAFRTPAGSYKPKVSVRAG